MRMRRLLRWRVSSAGLAQVLNLVRHQAEELVAAGGGCHTPVDREELQVVLRKAAMLIVMAAKAVPGQLDQLSDLAVRCQSHRLMGRHCGTCQEYDRAFSCPACDGVESEGCADVA